MPRKRTPRTYCVYIIELSRDCTKTPCALAPLYVGQTAHTPEERFAQHRAGGMLAAGKAHRYGVRLRYDLMKGLGPLHDAVRCGAGRKGGRGGAEAARPSCVLGLTT